MCFDRRKELTLIESATPCHDAQVVGSYRVSNPLRLTVLAAVPEDYIHHGATTVIPRVLQKLFVFDYFLKQLTAINKTVYHEVVQYCDNRDEIKHLEMGQRYGK